MIDFPLFISGRLVFRKKIVFQDIMRLEIQITGFPGLSCLSIVLPCLIMLLL